MATTTFPLPSLPSLDNAKKKRRPAGTPDPEAEVISLSPQTLLETDRYTCEICNQGFQREQNLQMHRRRHKVPWKLLKRESTAATKNGEGRKRVYVCPEPSCLHHDPSHALGDLVGIKKHFRRKHSDRRQWVCQKCDKGYAVQSDYKAHLKTCGTRGHTCDCGRVFSRVESFIEHQDTCDARRRQPACLSRTASSPSPSTDTDSNAATANFTLELQLLPPSTSCHPTTTKTTATTTASADTPATQLQLSLALASGSSDNGDRENLQDQLRLAAAEKALADAARQQAKRQLELAQQEFANAKRIRLQAQAELDKAFILRDNATKSIDSILFQVTCHECRQRLRPEHVHVPRDDNSLAVSAVTVGERSRISV